MQFCMSTVRFHIVLYIAISLNSLLYCSKIFVHYRRAQQLKCHLTKPASSCLWIKINHMAKTSVICRKWNQALQLSWLKFLYWLNLKEKNHTPGAIPTFDLADMPLCDTARVVVLLRWPLIDVDWGVGRASVQHNPVLKTKDKGIIS